MKKYVGSKPSILALPRTFKLSSVHLCMKDEEKGNYGIMVPCEIQHGADRIRNCLVTTAATFLILAGS